MRRVIPELFDCDVSDGGAGARRMRIRLARLCDSEASAKERHDSARRMVRRYYPKLLKVFDLIVRNGANRRESIFALAKSGLSWVAARQRYYRARGKLCKLFAAALAANTVAPPTCGRGRAFAFGRGGRENRAGATIRPLQTQAVPD